MSRLLAICLLSSLGWPATSARLHADDNPNRLETTSLGESTTIWHRSSNCPGPNVVFLFGGEPRREKLIPLAAELSQWKIDCGELRVIQVNDTHIDKKLWDLVRELRPDWLVHIRSDAKQQSNGERPIGNESATTNNHTSEASTRNRTDRSKRRLEIQFTAQPGVRPIAAAIKQAVELRENRKCTIQPATPGRFKTTDLARQLKRRSLVMLTTEVEPLRQAVRVFLGELAMLDN